MNGNGLWALANKANYQTGDLDAVCASKKDRDNISYISFIYIYIYIVLN